MYHEMRFKEGYIEQVKYIAEQGLNELYNNMGVK